MKTILILVILVFLIIYLVKKIKKQETTTTTTTKATNNTTTTTLATETTTTTTGNNTCVQIIELLGWGPTPEIAYSGDGDTYYGNNSSFDLTTTISANNKCTFTLGGYYSNGVIWKYTLDGINFISSGICTVALTTTTTTQIVGLLFVENLSSVNNLTNVVVNGTQVTLDNLTFPLVPGQTDTATTPYVGTYDVYVEMESYDSTSSMIVESAIKPCFGVTSIGTVGHTFDGVSISESIQTLSLIHISEPTRPY